jgi:hypothetical protein
MPPPTPERPAREVRACFDQERVRVYQAYSDSIADAALTAQTFVAPPFKMDRMTWIKPSFLWMMYRSGWASKPGQERVLAIDVTRTGFDQVMRQSCLSHFDGTVHRSERHWQELMRLHQTRIQWDPERDIHLRPLGYRTIQIGLGREAVRSYVDQWIVRIEDLTPHCRRIKEMLDRGDTPAALGLLPGELPLPVSLEAAAAIGVAPPAC